MITTLKDGSTVTNRRLGCLYSENEARDQYPVRMMLGLVKQPRSYTWHCSKVLDQGEEGSCVGHGVAHELISLPTACKSVDHDKAVEIYQLAQTLDPWPGSAYEGTTVDAGAKAAQKLGYIDNYYWADTIDDLIMGVGYAGPAVVGVDWYEGMAEADSLGFVRASGRVDGGHCTLLNGVNLKGEFFRGVNSWGTDWGVNGTFKISFSDMEKLLKKRGVACFFRGRHRL